MIYPRTSIFGDTYAGVPNPMVPHVNGYPTRFHGPMYDVPGVAKLPYVARPYIQQPMPTGVAGLGQAIPMAFDAGTGSQSQTELCSSMVLRGSVGALIGAAVAPEGREGKWGAIGFVMGSTLGEVGIVGIALAALWNKA